MNRTRCFFLLLLIGCALLLWLIMLYAKVAKEGNVSFGAGFDGYYCAQVARNLEDGEGFSTSMIFPVSLPRFGYDDVQPDFLKPPLYPALLAATFLLFGAGDIVIMALPFLFYLATIIALFVFGARVFSLRTAFVSGLLLLANMNFLLDAVGNGSEQALAVFIATLLLISIHHYNPSSRWYPLIPGILLGIGCMTMYSFLLFSIPICWMVWKESEREHRGYAVGLLSASCGIVIAPWLLRNMLLSGNPVFSYSWLKELHETGSSNLMMLSPETLLGGIGNIRRFLSSAVREVYECFYVTGNIMGALFIASLFFCSGTSDLTRTRNVLIGMIIVLMVKSFVYGAWHPYLPLYPFVILFGCAFFFHLVEHYSARSPRFTVAAAFVLVILNSVPVLRIAWQAGGTRYNREYSDSLMEKIAPERPLVSDVAPLITWYEHRKCILLPLNSEYWENMAEMLPEKPALLLSRNIGDLSDVTAGWHSKIYDRLSKGVVVENCDFEHGLKHDGNILLY